MARYAEIALAIPSQNPFSYAIPPAMAPDVSLGKRVFVPVHGRRMVGYVVGLSDECAFKDAKSIDAVIDATPVLDASMLALTRWMSEHYVCSWGQAIEAALPAPFKRGKLVMKSRAKKDGLKPQVVDPDDHPLTAAQKAAYDDILAKIHSRKPHTVLLHGVTGSGKTEVYMHLIRELIQEGRTSIVLVPEISLTPQVVDRFHSRFGDCVAVIHSRLTPAKRVEEWHRIRRGEAKVIVGARSALFSPAPDLGLIVIDEEHETSYKQDETPRYHARETAAKRVELEGAVLLLGSATPSFESYHATLAGRSDRVTLSERIERRPLPDVRIVDMRQQQQGKKERIFSMPLEEAIRDALSKKEQTMLLLNRRGFSTYLHCSSCGHVMTCPNCRIALAYHFDTMTLLCHLCEHKDKPERLCPGCQKNYLHYFGLGTQKVEQEAKRLFPDARVARMDTDSTSRKDAHEEILRAFQRREIDVLIGTQMIAKGHDFPHVSLIGVVSADTALHRPDFRASERTFDLLTQVAGRAGRGDIPGKVIIQTFVPHHPAVQSAKEHDFFGFYDKEIGVRKELGLPPFTRMVQLIVKGRSERDVVRQILEFARHAEAATAGSGIRYLGPAPCVTSKQHGQFFWNLYAKGPDIEDLVRRLKGAMESFKRSGVSFTLDVDPQ